MQAAGISSNTASYNCALNGLAKDRQWNRARSVFRKMVDSGLSPDDHSYNGLVEAAGMGSTSPRQSMIQASSLTSPFMSSPDAIPPV